MNKRQQINKILRTHIDVNKNEDYTHYKALITAIENWHKSEQLKAISDLKDFAYEVCPLHRQDDLYEIVNHL